MSELGQLLKSAREEKGLTIEDLQEVTKIQKRYLEAIENGSYHLLPGPFYTRAFIRNIAETLNLNTDYILEQYEDALPTTNTEIVEPVPRRRKKFSQPSLLGQWITRFLVFAFLVLILFIIYIFVVNQFPPTEQPEVQNQTPEVVDNLNTNHSDNGTSNEEEKDAKEETQPPPPEPILTFVKEEGKTSYYQISNVERIELRMKAADGQVWYQINKGRNGELIEMDTMDVENEKTWEFPEESNIFIRLGATKFMEVYINGQIIDLSEKPDGYRLDIILAPNVQ